jgi:hypothetical protein
MKRVFFVLFIFCLFFNSLAYATPWAVVANRIERSISTIDVGTNPPTVYGPFLAGQLGEMADVFDVALTPDGRYALVSNFYTSSPPSLPDSTLHRIDISNPRNPILVGTITLTNFNVLDIAIAPNGRFALISDGRGGSNTNKLAIIDLNSFTFTGYYTFPAGTTTTAVTISPDSSTYIVCDRDNHRIWYGSLDPDTGDVLSATNSSTGALSYPINVNIAPDGETVLVATALTSIPVYRITGIGTLVSSGSVLNVPQRQMSFAFSPDGQIAYFTAAGSSAPNTHTLSWLNINSPGNVTLGGANVATLPMAGTDRLMGTDVLAVYPNGSHALIGNQLLTGTIVNYVSLVDLTSFVVSSINTNTNYPVAIDIKGRIDIHAIPTMTEWGMILFVLLAGAGSVYWLRRRKRAER